jgi:SAM-dependent methyltransferase
MREGFQNARPSACKVCGNSGVAIAGIVDFNRVKANPPPFEPAGVGVEYWQCAGCGFAWAPGFDNWTDDLFLKEIYNEGLARIEPLDNAVQRAGNVIPLVRRFVDHAGCRNILDFGCGPGVLIERLRHDGLAAAGYDRFYPGYSERPKERFDLVTCFEVMEHVNDIDQTIDEMASFLAPDGILLIGTFLTSQPLDVNWWYCSPRSGHIAFWTFSALSKVFNRRKLNVASDGKMFHFVFPDSAKHKMQAVFGG